MRQKTIKDPVTVEGRGLFSGHPCTLRFLPAPQNTGIVFVRQGADGEVRLPAAPDKLLAQPRRTSLADGQARAETIEHVMAAVWAMGVDNLLIELSADETPSPDSSSAPFTEALASAGIVQQSAEQATWVIGEPVTVSEDDTMLAALPGPDDCLDILYDLDYTDGQGSESIGRQVFAFRLNKDDFATELATSRTFVLEDEARKMQADGIGTHLSASDVVVMGPEGPIDNELRFPNEHARHKVCDLVGDLALLGRRLYGRIVAYKSGHKLNHALVRKLTETIAEQEQSRRLSTGPVMDIR